MSNWCIGTYKKEEINKRMFLTTLTRITTLNKKYNIFRMDNGGQAVVVFSDQPDILKTIEANEGSVFALKFFKTGNKKAEYQKEINGETLIMKTIAGVMVIAHGTSEDSRVLVSTPEGLIILD